MRRFAWLLFAVILIVGVSMGYTRWRQDSLQPEEAAPVGNNLQAEEDDTEVLATDVEGNSEPVLTMSAGQSRASLFAWQEAEVTRYQLRGQLPELAEGFYSVWLENREQSDLVNLGQLTQEKGGWLLEFQTKGRVTGYDELMITREFVDDSKPEEVILRGELPERG